MAKSKKYKMKTSYYIVLTLLFKKEEDDTWIAECKELGTSTFGDSFEEVSSEIKELVVLHLNTLEKTGELQRFFKENKIKLLKKSPKEVKINSPVTPNVYVESFAQSLALA